MDEQLITIRLNSVEWIALEIVLERLRKSYQEAEKVYGHETGQLFGTVKFPVYQYQFEAAEVLDNVIRMKFGFMPFE